MYCKHCGSMINIGWIVCPNCGKQINTTGVQVSDKSLVITALLALFLGGFGAHRFYVGRNGSAILMLLFFWTFIPVVIAFFDLILILCGRFKDKYGRQIK